MFVRGLGFLLGGFPDEIYILKTLMYPQLRDPKLEKSMGQCSLTMCWTGWVYVNLFCVIVVFRIIFSDKFAKLDFFKRFDDAVDEIYREKAEKHIKRDLAEGIKKSMEEALLNPGKKNKDNKKESKKDKKKDSDSDEAGGFAALMKKARKGGDSDEDKKKESDDDEANKKMVSNKKRNSMK